MRIRVQAWQLALVVLLSVLVPIATILAFKPTPHTQQHKNNWDYWTTVRTVPMRITEVDGNTVYWSFEDNHEIKLGSFATDEATKFPKDFRPGEYIAVYCEAHMVLYELISLTPPH